MSSLDAHAGATSAQIIEALRGAFTAVLEATAALTLRPGSIETHTLLGLIDVAVYFPAADVAAVDALADRFGLPAAESGGVLYTRVGLAELGPLAGTLVVRCARPGIELPDPFAAAQAPADEPVVITGELAAVDAAPARAALPAGGAA